MLFSTTRLPPQSGIALSTDRFPQFALIRFYTDIRISTATTLNNLAVIYADQGDFAKAETMLEQNIRDLQSVKGSEVPLTASMTSLAAMLKVESDSETVRTLNRVFEVHYRRGEFEEAARSQTKALEIAQAKEGQKGIDVAIALDNLSAILFSQGDYTHALEQQKRALDIFQSISGDSLDTAKCLDNIGKTYLAQGDVQDSIPPLQHALRITERIFGPKDERTENILGGLAVAYWAQGDLPASRECAMRLQSIHDKRLNDMLAFSSERERLDFESHFSGPVSFFAMLGDAHDLATTILREKGIVLDSLAEDRRVASQSGPDLNARRKLEQLQVIRNRIFQLAHDTPPPKATPEILRQRREILENLRVQAEGIESVLGYDASTPNGTRHSLQVTPEQVQAALPKRTVLWNTSAASNTRALTNGMLLMAPFCFYRRANRSGYHSAPYPTLALR